MDLRTAYVTRLPPVDLNQRIVGRPTAPVLSLHGLGDLVVQRAIRSVNHCEFSPHEARTAWNNLRTWVQAKGSRARRDARPAGDNLQNRAVVADPRYGHPSAPLPVSPLTGNCGKVVDFERWNPAVFPQLRTDGASTQSSAPRRRSTVRTCSSEAGCARPVVSSK